MATPSVESADLTDVAILGAGISGLAAAHHCAKAGLRCVVVEASNSAGGCIHTTRAPDGYWFELGAHTLYNSYGALLEMLLALDLRDQLQPREKAPYRLWVDGKVRSVPSQLSMGEIFASAWRAFSERKDGHTVSQYYGRLVGKGNWRRVFSPLLSAVPSQRADDFPAEMLFKKRPRRKDFPRTFTLKSGLSTLIDRLTGDSRVQVMLGVKAESIARAERGFRVALADGSNVDASSLILAIPPNEGSRLLDPLLPVVAAELAKIAVAQVESTGVVVAKEKLRFPRVAGLVPLDDVFFSVVSRDVVPDPRLRALAFHFRAGLAREERLAKIAAVTGAAPESFTRVADHPSVLPSPTLGHAEIVSAIDQGIAGSGVYITGNFFGGLAIEDCVLRSRAEVARLRAETPQRE